MEDKTLRALKKVKDISLNNLVVKDNFLVETKYSLSVIEQKIVLMLISQLDSIGAEDLDYYEFKISKLLEYLSLGAENYTFLQKVLNELYKREVCLVNKEERRTFKSRWISSFDYLGKKGIVRLGLEAQLKPYLLIVAIFQL